MPQTASATARSAFFVVNPLVSHIRRNRQSALEFAVERFKAHRVTAIGEQHAGMFVGSLAENGCVRTFLRDLCRALHNDSDARFRYLVVEFDEAAMEGDNALGDHVAPPGTVNRKAHWFAAYMQSSLALKEVFLTIAREIPDTELEVVGIDRREGNLAIDRSEDWFLGTDIQQGPQETPGEFRARRREIRTQRYEELNQASREREEAATALFESRVLARLGSDRALIYYGADHIREGQPEPDQGFGFSENTFVRRLIANDNGLSGDDVYAIATVYPGTLRSMQATSARHGRRDDGAHANLVRIFDLLRAEFPADHSLGFDVDEARFALLPIDRNTAYPLGEQFDGCLFFRDLNLWDGHARPPEMAPMSARPGISITSVIPSLASPGNAVFVYGYVLTSELEVAVHTRSAAASADLADDTRFPCTEVHLINENLLRATIPAPGGIPVSGQRATIEVRRRQPPDLRILSEYETAVLRDAFRYRIG